MNYKILFSAKASEDLRNILLYIAETNSVNVAMDYVDTIEQTIEKMKTFAYLGKVPLIRTLQLQNLRVLTVGSHNIYYKVDEANKAIKIYTIKHVKQKQNKI